MQQFGDLTGQVPPSLGEADTAMREAGRQLGEGNDAGAGGSEQKAIEALQKGGREMGQAMAKQFGPQGGQDGNEQDGDGDGPMGLTLHDGQDDDQGRGYRSGPPPDRAQHGARSAWAPLRAGQLGRRRERRCDGAGGTRAATDPGDPGGAAPPRRRAPAPADRSWTISTGC